MEERKPIKKEVIDLRASISQLEPNQHVILPWRDDLRPGSIRAAVSRINSEGGPRYSAHETVNGTLVERVS